MARIFLSHASPDKPAVRRLRDALREAGHEPWLDEDEVLVGESIPAAVERGLTTTDFVVVCLSRAALDSGWVEAELHNIIMRQFKERVTRVLPVRLESVDPPRIIEHIGYTDLFPARQAYLSGLRKLVRSLEIHGERRREHAVGAARRPALSADVVGPKLTLSPELRARLLETVGTSEWPRDDLVDAYYASAPPGGRHDFDAADADDLLARMVVRLAGALGQSDGAHPILRFVLRLMKLASAPALEGALLDWLIDASAHLGVDPERQRALRQEVEEPVPGHARELHLVLVIEPSDCARGRYAVRASRVLVRPGKPRWDDGDAEWLIAEDAPLCSLQDIPALLNDLLLCLDEDLRRTDNELTVDLVVPLSLLGCEADQWELPLGVESVVPAGVEYELVVRSWERAYDPRCRRIVPRWQAKWKRLCSACGEATWICGLHELDAPIAPRLHNEGPARVVLGFAPPAGTEGGSPVLRDLIDTGTPAAVWPRRPPKEAALHACIDRLTAAAPPPSWPSEVRRFRREAHVERDAEHPGHYLSLLWDSPHHLLPDARAAARFESSFRPRRTPR